MNRYYARPTVAAALVELMADREDDFAVRLAAALALEKMDKVKFSATLSGSASLQLPAKSGSGLRHARPRGI